MNWPSWRTCQTSCGFRFHLCLHLAGYGYVAFVTDVFARKIVGWRVSTSMTTGFVLDALNQAICQRAPSRLLTS